MYGKRRVVLSTRPVTITGLKVVSVTGGRSHHPVGFWYERDGKYFADLKSAEQWWQQVNNRTIAIKGVGGFSTKTALRDFIQYYWRMNTEKEFAP